MSIKIRIIKKINKISISNFPFELKSENINEKIREKAKFYTMNNHFNISSTMLTTKYIKFTYFTIILDEI